MALKREIVQYPSDLVRAQLPGRTATVAKAQLD